MKSKLILLIIFTIVISFTNGYSQRRKKESNKKPAWVKYEYREAKYPKRVFVVGFASENLYGDDSQEQMLDRIEGYAKTQLVESIYVTIKSITTWELQTHNQETNDYFRQTSVSLSKLDLTGLQVETYFDENKKSGYAFAYAEKTKISERYRTKIKNLEAQIRNKFKTGKQYEENNEKQLALKSYFECIPLLREVEEAQTLILSFENIDLNHPDILYEIINQLRTDIMTTIGRLQKSNLLTLDDACYMLAKGLKLQCHDDNRNLYNLGFSYEDTKMGSPFAVRLSRTLEQKLMNEKIQMTTNKMEISKDESALLLAGTYWEETNNIKIMVSITDAATGKNIACAETKLPIKWLNDNKINYKPSDKTNASNISAINNEVITNSGLNVIFATNKGTENLTFTEGIDTLKLYIKANKACYVRLIYYLADGSKVLMLDNYYIDKMSVNKFYELPDKFEVAAPFGVETLQLNAQTRPFDALKTKPYYHYKLIVDDIDKILANTRGFKPTKDDDGIAEKRLILTTLPKGAY